MIYILKSDIHVIKWEYYNLGMLHFSLSKIYVNLIRIENKNIWIASQFYLLKNRIDQYNRTSLIKTGKRIIKTLFCQNWIMKVRATYKYTLDLIINLHLNIRSRLILIFNFLFCFELMDGRMKNSYNIVQFLDNNLVFPWSLYLWIPNANFAGEMIDFSFLLPE